MTRLGRVAAVEIPPAVRLTTVGSATFALLTQSEQPLTESEQNALLTQSEHALTESEQSKGRGTHPQHRRGARWFE